jgi:ketosteroid isomerase-like protein
VTSSVPTPVEIFEQVLRAAQSGEVQEMLDLCADDVVFEFPFAPPGRPAEVRGKEPLGRYLAAVPSRIQFDGLSNLETDDRERKTARARNDNRRNAHGRRAARYVDVPR